MIFCKPHCIFPGITVCFRVVTGWLRWYKPLVPLESKSAPLCLVILWPSQNPRHCLLFFFLLGSVVPQSQAESTVFLCVPWCTGPASQG